MKRITRMEKRDYANTNIDLMKRKKRKKRMNKSDYANTDIDLKMLSFKDTMMFNKDQLKKIRNGLKEGLDVSLYAKKEFNIDQMRQIVIGLKYNKNNKNNHYIDVSIYAKPEFDYKQMKEIKSGLIKNLDVSKYANPKFNADQMNKIKTILQNGVDFSKYDDCLSDYNKKVLPRFIKKSNKRLTKNDYAKINLLIQRLKGTGKFNEK